MALLLAPHSVVHDAGRQCTNESPHCLESLKTPEIQKSGQQPRQRPTDFIVAENEEVYLDEAGSEPQVLVAGLDDQ